MKKISNSLYIVAILASLGFLTSLTSCEDDPTAKETALKKLSAGTWTLNNVTVDGVNKNDLFAGFVIQFSKTNGFTASNGEPVWPAAGIWQFKDDRAKVVVRDDGKEVEITSISDAALTLTMVWDKTTFGTGRAKSLSGTHVFELKR